MSDGASHYHFDHTAKRLRERYALELSHKEYVELCAKCVLREVKAASKRIGPNMTVYLIPFKDRQLLAAFDEFKMLITTVLPPPSSN